MLKEFLDNIVIMYNFYTGKYKTDPTYGQPIPSVSIPNDPPIPPAPSKKLAALGDSFTDVNQLINSLDLANSLKWQAIVLHHSDTEDGKGDDFKAILKYHTETMGWSTIAYNVLIEEVNGKHVYRVGRPITEPGSHAIGFNKIALGFCCVGDFDKDVPNEIEWKMMKDLCLACMKQFNFPAKKVYGHRETYALRGVPQEKTCPGNKWDMEKFRSELV